MRRPLCVATAMAALACGPDPGRGAVRSPDTEPALLTVDTVSVDVPLSLASQLYVEHDALVYARTAGIVESVDVDLGTPVSAGQRLAQIEDVDQAIALAQAEQTYARSEREVARQRDLAKIGGLSASDSEAGELAYQSAALALRQARRNFDLTRIVAPFAGVVSARSVRPGRLVASGDSLFRVSALAPLRASVRVPETASGDIQVGGAARVVGVSGRTARARVIRASPTYDAASATREFLLELESGSGMRPGAAVTVEVGAERRTVIALPPAALAEGGYVLVADSGRTALRAVTLGARLPDGRLEVVSGLSVGERVVLAKAR